ncbi:hypothetical protein PCASD_08100 [Puccinia coronata f. sp. avenae]|uniref:Uncharacterized protein n=1 Tax=Puccinia coronata f. sp. avenae TaxID=200324 RepID=A0A2N5VA71_9BASI|nr:hypothetical protein PCASD_08100 [Puccinia coronata f. sp. avenae]
MPYFNRSVADYYAGTHNSWASRFVLLKARIEYNPFTFRTHRRELERSRSVNHQAQDQRFVKEASGLGGVKIKNIHSSVLLRVLLLCSS